MHDTFNTRGGQFGFIVKLTDGRVFREDKVTWDEVPRDVRVESLAIAHLSTDHHYFDMTNYARYLFCNEAKEGRASGLARHSAKIFVGCGVGGDNERAHVIKLDFDGLRPKVIMDEEMSVSQLAMEPSAFRLGV